MNSTVLPDSILTKMSPEARATLGKAGKTAAECQTRLDKQSERDLQCEIAALLTIRSIFYLRSPMHKRVTQKKGVPDFIVVLPRGIALLVECKTITGKLSDEQTKMAEEYKKKTKGHSIHVVRTLAEFKTLLDTTIMLYCKHPKL